MSSLLLVLAWPLFLFIVLVIKLDSRGPVFYLGKRVGLNGRIFNMYKFRTMYDTQAPLGPSISPRGDPRVTSVGRLLRRLKLNELPQLLNILKGEMTLVGPRPETPDLAAAYPESAKVIFTVKPGLVGPNQILGRNEEELYPSGADPVQFYLEHILPQKIPVDVQYITDKSLLKNLKYLFLGVKVTVTGAISRQHLWDNRSQFYLMLADLAACVLSFFIAHFLRYESIRDPESVQIFLMLLPWVVLVRLPIFIYFGFYHTLIRHLSLYDIKRIFKGVALSSLALVAVSFLLGLTMLSVSKPSSLAMGKPPLSSYSRSVFLIDWFCLTIMLVGMRALLKKLYRRYRIGEVVGDDRNVLIWGAGDAGELCLHYLRKHKNPTYTVSGFIDDDPHKRRKRLNGVKVLGDRNHLEVLIRLYKIQEVFVAIPSASEGEVQSIMEACQALGLKACLFQFNATAYGDFRQESPQRLPGEDLSPAGLRPSLNFIRR